MYLFVTNEMVVEYFQHKNFFFAMYCRFFMPEAHGGVVPRRFQNESLEVE